MSFLGNIFAGVGASSKFQKHRLIFTNKNDMDIPNANSLKQILATLSGKDSQTRQQIGFATIIRKINNSDSNSSWIYLIKNLIILDSAIQQRLFLEEFSNLQLPILNQFKQLDKKYVQFYFDGFLKKYFTLMKLRSRCLLKRPSLFRVQRSQKQQFLQLISIQQCQWHIDITQQLFTLIFDVLEYKKYEIAQFKLIQYIFLQILYKLTNCYSTQLLSITRFLSFLQKIDQKQIIVFRNKVIKFNKNAQNIISFVQQFKCIKGFQTINYKQFDPKKNQILQFIQQSLRHKKNQNIDTSFVKVQKLTIQQKITINRKPRDSVNQKQGQIPTLIPRFTITEQKPPKKKVFENYINGYSEDFPPKQLISYDSMDKQQGDENEEGDQGQFYRSSSISRFNINVNKQQRYSQINTVEYIQIPIKIHKFSNIYSNLNSEWIYS